MRTRWDETLTSLIQETLEHTVEKLENGQREGIVVHRENSHEVDPLPSMKVIKNVRPGEESGELSVELVAGRNLWLWHIKRLVTKTSRALREHRWTILIAPAGLPWFTSDDPVIKLNNYKDETYDFKGGWSSTGTEILLPLSPRHLLYTKVGERPTRRGTVVRPDIARAIRRFIAEHAHRMIFSATEDPEIPQLRPRVINADLCRQEAEQWKTWHQQQTDAERKLLDAQDE